MTSDGSNSDSPPRPYRWRYGSLHLIMPWIALVGGLLSIVRGVNDLTSSGDPLFIYVGAGLVALAVVIFFVDRWQATLGN